MEAIEKEVGVTSLLESLTVSYKSPDGETASSEHLYDDWPAGFLTFLARQCRRVEVCGLQQSSHLRRAKEIWLQMLADLSYKSRSVAVVVE